ncbi:hypothetical protein D9619_008797 [Psilocybe cf. subviscida]|uniref:Uncharacterized protein n=1 Tax=Psilocybe cf. subviscida TaxID=2480587 RepID=A0A8H5F139_9AGAR|nr:hypothetical protein D9619_008797 [Psilocybe cf. subviscida]
MSESPPPSPMKIMQAQLLLKKLSKAKKKTTKSAAKSKPAPKEKEATENSDNEEGEGSDKENTEKSSISWVKNPVFTSKLLSIIEESLQYRHAFGFKVPQDAKVSSTGQTATKTGNSLASALFPSSPMPIAKLRKAVVARIRALKSDYTKYKKELGTTGHGLVIEDRAQEIKAGSAISNVWEKMQARFPWYIRLHLLLSASPIYDGSGVANSATPLNTSVLGTQQLARELSPEWDLDAVDDSFHSDHNDDIDNFSETHETDTPAQTDDADVFGPPSVHAEVNSTPTPSLSPVPAVPLVISIPAMVTLSAPAALNVRKRKDPFEDAKALTESYLSVRVETEKIRAESKRTRLELTSNKDLEIERLKATQQDRQHQHELAMMDKRILLAQLEAGNVCGSGSDGYNHGHGHF